MVDETPDNLADVNGTPPVDDAAALAEAALNDAQHAVETLSDVSGVSGEQAMNLPDLGQGNLAEDQAGIQLLNDVDLQVKIELGRTHMLVEDVLKLGDGAVVELDKLAGDPVDVYVNDRLIARGEVLVLNDNFCVRVGEVLADGPEAEMLSQAIGQLDETATASTDSDAASDPAASVEGGNASAVDEAESVGTPPE